MENGYVINVAKVINVNGEDQACHFFRTKAILGKSTALLLFKELKEKFPEPDYNITCYLYRTSGKFQDW